MMSLEDPNITIESPLILKEASQSSCSYSKEEIISELKKVLRLTGPLVSVNVVTFLLQVISVMFVGHLGDLSLAAASMATSFASITGFSLLRGMASALDTFCGQSYGAKQYHMLGIFLQRAMIVLLLCSIPLAFIWANAAYILVFFRQDPEISAAAGHYARFMIPSIFGFAIQECHVRFLQTQNNVIPMMVTSGITIFIHIFACWGLVFKSGLGNTGAALANAISCWINALLLMLYVRKSPSCNRTWTGFSKEALHGIPDYIRLAIPSAIMLSLEIWSFEMMVLLSGLLPDPKLETSVLSICLNTCSMIYMIPLGLSAAVSTRISNELGAGRPRAACLALYVVMLIVITEGILVGSTLIFGRNVWGYFYSAEYKIVKYVGEMLVFVAATHIFDGIQSILAGTVRGCGWQKIGAITNLGAYYVIGVPCSILLAFVYHLGGKGLWTGLLVAVFAQGVGFLTIILASNWEKESQKATERVHSNMIRGMAPS